KYRSVVIEQERLVLTPPPRHTQHWQRQPRFGSKPLCAQIIQYERIEIGTQGHAPHMRRDRLARHDEFFEQRMAEQRKPCILPINPTRDEQRRPVTRPKRLEDWLVRLPQRSVLIQQG